MKIEDYIHYFDNYYFKDLAYDFDNTGALIISDKTDCTGIVITLDITNDCIDFAKSKKCNLIVSHHPMIFTPIKSIDKYTNLGSYINKIIKNDMTVFSMHTNFDVHYDGMNKAVNDELSKYIDFSFIDFIERIDYPKDFEHIYGIGSYLTLKKAVSIDILANIFQKAFNINNIRTYKSRKKMVKNIAICPGSGGSFLNEILHSKVDCYISGDLGHHKILDLNESNINYIDATHSGLEKIFVKFVYNKLKKEFKKERIFKYEYQN